MVQIKVEVEKQNHFPTTASQKIIKIYYMLRNRQAFIMPEQERLQTMHFFMKAQNARVQFRGVMYPFYWRNRNGAQIDLYQ